MRLSSLESHSIFPAPATLLPYRWVMGLRGAVVPAAAPHAPLAIDQVRLGWANSLCFLPPCVLSSPFASSLSCSSGFPSGRWRFGPPCCKGPGVRAAGHGGQPWGAADSGPPNPHRVTLGLSFLLRTVRGLGQLLSEVPFSLEYSVT